MEPKYVQKSYFFAPLVRIRHFWGEAGALVGCLGGANRAFCVRGVTNSVKSADTALLSKTRVWGPPRQLVVFLLTSYSKPMISGPGGLRARFRGLAPPSAARCFPIKFLFKTDDFRAWRPPGQILGFGAPSPARCLPIKILCQIDDIWAWPLLG